MACACAQFQPLTLKMGSNWPKYGPFTFPKDLGTFLREIIFFAIFEPLDNTHTGVQLQQGVLTGAVHLDLEKP